MFWVVQSTDFFCILADLPVLKHITSLNFFYLRTDHSDVTYSPTTEYWSCNLLSMGPTLSLSLSLWRDIISVLKKDTPLGHFLNHTGLLVVNTVTVCYREPRHKGGVLYSLVFSLQKWVSGRQWSWCVLRVAWAHLSFSRFGHESPVGCVFSNF